MASLPRIPNASNVPNKKGSVKRSASPVAVNAKLSAMMFRQGGPIQIPQDMRTHTHELRALKDWVERFLQRTNHSRRSDTEIQDIIADLETYSACYFDLVRQSTVHSVELGRVQALLWNDFINLFQRLFTIHERTQSEVDLEQTRVATQNEALKDRTELRQVRLELEEKLKLQDDTIRRKDRTIQLHVMHEKHLEAENQHLRELLSAEEFNQTTKRRDKGLAKMVGNLDGLIEDVESETRRQHNVVMDMKRLVDEVRVASELGPPKNHVDFATEYDTAEWFEKHGLEGFLNGSPEELERLERLRMMKAGLLGPDGNPLPLGPDGQPLQYDAEGRLLGPDGLPIEDASKKKKGSSPKKDAKEEKSWDEKWEVFKPKNGHPCYTRKSTEKLIAQIYFDKITADEIDDRDNKPRSTLPQFCYECILNKYGLKTLAKKNMNMVMHSVDHWAKESTRVKLFAQFCGKKGVDRLDLNVLNFYLFLTKFTHGNPKKVEGEVGLGLNCLSFEMEVEGAQLELKDAEAAAAWLHTECFQSPKEVVKELSTQFRMSGVTEKHGIRYMPFDAFTEIMCKQWEVELDNTKKTLESMFISADVDSDGILTYDEFSSLVWSIKPETSGREMTRLYNDAQSSSSSDSLSPEDFVKVASDHGLLSHMLQSKEFTTLQRGDDFAYLASVWEEQHQRVRQDLNMLKESECEAELHGQLRLRLARFEELLDEKENLAAAWLCYRTLESGIRRAIVRYVDKTLAEDSDDDVM